MGPRWGRIGHSQYCGFRAKYGRFCGSHAHLELVEWLRASETGFEQLVQLLRMKEEK